MSAPRPDWDVTVRYGPLDEPYLAEGEARIDMTFTGPCAVVEAIAENIKMQFEFMDLLAPPAESR